MRNMVNLVGISKRKMILINEKLGKTGLKVYRNK